MRLRNNSIKSGFPLLLAVGILTACGANTPEAPASNASQTTISSLQIDAAAGGYGATPDDPANKYIYVNLDSGQEVDLLDADAERNGAWHIAFKRTSIKLNGGVSGPGAVKGVVADAQTEFYDAATADPVVSVFTNATADSELPAFNAVTSAEGLAFAEDRYIPYIKGDGSSAGWWLYSGAPTYSVSANPEQWWLIKSAAADSYAKFHVTDIVQASRDITLELFIQGAADSAFSTTASAWTANIGAGDGSRCFDIDTATGVDCEAAAADWDLKVEVNGRAWNIWTNGGVGGSGSGGAFGPFDTTSVAGYVSGTASPGGTNITRMYGRDSAGGTFSKSQANTWYAYGLQGASKLWPNYRVYAVDTGTGYHKLQILSYYDLAGVSGNYSIRTAPLSGQSTFESVNVALGEWAVTPDRNTVTAGPVRFTVSNDGPVDVHELVIVKTDLAVNSLPVDANGNVDENAAGISIIGEIENIAVAANAQASFELEPGNYVLICNIWDAAEAEAHYSQGMRVAFTVQ